MQDMRYTIAPRAKDRGLDSDFDGEGRLGPGKIVLLERIIETGRSPPPAVA
jgi:hypothetical protein